MRSQVAGNIYQRDTLLCGNDHFVQFSLRGWAGDEIIPDEVQERVRIFIDDLSSQYTPVVNNVVDNVMRSTSDDEWITEIVMRQQVVVDGYVVGTVANQQAGTVGFLLMTAAVKGFADD